MSDIREQIIEQVNLVRKYAYELGMKFDDETADSLTNSRNNLINLINSQQAEITRLNAIIADMKQVGDIQQMIIYSEVTK